MYGIDNIVIDANKLNLVTAIATVIIALTAVMVGIYQSFTARKHNRLSVRPLLVMEVNLDPTMQGFGVSVANKGVGPAIVTNFRVLVDGKDETDSFPNIWLQVLKTLDLDYSFLQHFSPQKGTAIAPGESLPLITADPNQIDEDMELHIKKCLPHIGCVVSYQSVYNEFFKEKYEGGLEFIKNEK